MTTRRWMILVAVVAVGLGVARILWLRGHYRKWPTYYAACERLNRTLKMTERQRDKAEKELAAVFGHKPDVMPSDEMRKFEEESDRAAEANAALKAKYERAAPYPWLTVEPDPPIPD